MSESRLVNRNVTSARGRTSVRLEPELWAALEEICARERLSMTEAVKAAEARYSAAGPAIGRTSAIRVHIVDYFRSAATEDGHKAAGHGIAR